MQEALIVFLGILSLMYPQTGEASVAYSVTPLVLNESLEARDIVTRELKINNIGDTPVTLYPTVNNISLKEGGTIEKFLPPVESDRTSSLASWIEISRAGMNLKPGESKTIPITFRINPNPVPGAYHAFIGFGHGRNRDEAELLVANGQAPGVVASVNIEDKKNEVLKLSRFMVQRFIVKTHNEAALYEFKNPGDEVLVPKGEIIIYDHTGKEVQTIPVNAESTRIEPGGFYTFKAPIAIGGMFGKYKAFLSVEYGNTQRGSVQDTSFFYVFPLRTLAVVLGGLMCAVAFAAWYAHRKYFDVELDDSDRLTMHIRDGQSEPLHHDIDLTKT
jgi:hypothetical protein